MEKDNFRKASLEFVNALNILKKGKNNRDIERETLQLLIKVNKSMKDGFKVQYYESQLNKIQP